MGEIAAQHRLGVGLERGGPQQPVDEPLDRTGGVRLQGRGRPGGARVDEAEHARVAQRGQRRLGRPRSRRHARAGLLVLGRRERGLEAGRAQRAALHPPRGGRGEGVQDVVDEQRAHARLALVVGRRPAEREQLGRAADHGVEQVALGVEAVLAQAQAQPGGGVERAALVVAQERLGGGGAREGVLAQAAQEGRPHAPGPQRARARDGHEPGARIVVGAHLEVVQHARELVGRRHQRAIRRAASALAELAQRRAQRRRRRARRAPRGRPAPARRRGAGRRRARCTRRPGAGTARPGRPPPRRGGRARAGRSRDGRASHSRRAAVAVAAPSLRARCSRRSASPGRASLPGVRSQASRSSALPLPSAQRSRATTPRPSAVCPATIVRSSANGTSSAPKTCASSAACSRGSRTTTAMSSGAKPCSAISRATWAATSSSSARSPPPSSSSSASPGSGRRPAGASNSVRSRACSAGRA